jgi:hypothetical protein
VVVVLQLWLRKRIDERVRLTLTGVVTIVSRISAL